EDVASNHLVLVLHVVVEGDDLLALLPVDAPRLAGGRAEEDEGTKIRATVVHRPFLPPEACDGKERADGILVGERYIAVPAILAEAFTVEIQVPELRRQGDAELLLDAADLRLCCGFREMRLRKHLSDRSSFGVRHGLRSHGTSEPRDHSTARLARSKRRRSAIGSAPCFPSALQRKPSASPISFQDKFTNKFIAHDSSVSSPFLSFLVLKLGTTDYVPGHIF